jgi:hypothetical protein
VKTNTYGIVRGYVAFVVALAIGALANLIFCLLAVFLFAAENGGKLLRWYFETGNGALFALVTFVFALFIFRYTKNLKIVFN